MNTGVVVIGRNEGERLRRCLASLEGSGSAVVYVDSGSSDSSVTAAREFGAEVVELDRRTPFTAARARNAGLEHLLELFPALELVQFVDGDCELQPTWMTRAKLEIRADPSLAVVCGRRRERHPEHSIYNRLCDVEWNTPVGLADSSGGDAMMRVRALREVGGFDATLIAGEEPELCVRLRQRGWKIARVDAEMTLHDAAMSSFGQWWRRAVRSGHAYAERLALHGVPLRKNVSIGVSGVLLPAAALATVLPTGGLSLLLPVALYSAQMLRSYRRVSGRGNAPSDSRLYAFFSVLAAVPHAQGQLAYLWARVKRKRSQLIEYKTDR